MVAASFQAFMNLSRDRGKLEAEIESSLAIIPDKFVR